LNSVNYKLLNYSIEPLYTKITVRIPGPSEPAQILDYFYFATDIFEKKYAAEHQVMDQPVQAEKINAIIFQNSNRSNLTTKKHNYNNVYGMADTQIVGTGAIKFKQQNVTWRKLPSMRTVPAPASLRKELLREYVPRNNGPIHRPGNMNEHLYRATPLPRKFAPRP
jgi:hypothetical protein